MLRLLLAHPDVEIGALTAGSNAGEPLGALQPHLVPLADRVLEETTRRGARRPRRGLPRRCRTASPAAIAAGAAGDDVVVIDCGADFRLDRRRPTGSGSTAATHAGTWPYGLPELPGQRDAARGATPDRRARLLPDGLHAGPRPGRRRRARRRRRRRRGRRLRHQRRRQGAQAAPARQRGDGLAPARTASAAPTGTPPRSSRTSPALTDGDVRVSASRRCWCRCRAASSPPARRRRPPRRDRRRRARRLPEGVRRRAVRAPAAARGSGRRPSRSSAPTPCTCRSPSTRRAGRLVAVGAVDNLAKGTAGARRPVHEPRPRPRPRPLGLHHDRGSRHERHRPRRASGPPASPPASSRPAPRTSPSSSTTARRTPPPRVFTANRCKANPVLWSQEVVKDGVVRAVVLNSGGANCYTGAEGFQTTHAVAEQVAAGLGHRRRRRRRLLHRPDRPGQRPRRACSPASTPRVAALGADGGDGRRRRRS